jgi:hypothetical protein
MIDFLSWMVHSGIESFQNTSPYFWIPLAIGWATALLMTSFLWAWPVWVIIIWLHVARKG